MKRNISPPPELEEMRREFEIEKNAKNQAYAFIIAAGLLDDFSNFCKQVKTNDWHKTAVSALAEQASKKNDNT